MTAYTEQQLHRKTYTNPCKKVCSYEPDSDYK